MEADNLETVLKMEQREENYKFSKGEWLKMTVQVQAFKEIEWLELSKRAENWQKLM